MCSYRELLGNWRARLKETGATMPANSARPLPKISVSEFEAGKMLGVSAKSLQRARVAGEIKYFRMSDGGKVLFRISELERFAAKMEARQ
jgi:Helix-turn-helix domain